MMRCYLYHGERLVFEGEGWGIVIDDGYDSRHYREGFVYGTHQECTKDYQPNDLFTKDDKYPYGQNCWDPSMDVTNGTTVAMCFLCEAAVPEGVQALIIIQTWAKNGERNK